MIHTGRGSGKAIAARIYLAMQAMGSLGMYNIGALTERYNKMCNKVITQPIRKEGPHCGAKQRKKYSTPGRYNFMEPTFKNKA